MSENEYAVKLHGSVSLIFTRLTIREIFRGKLFWRSRKCATLVQRERRCLAIVYARHLTPLRRCYYVASCSRTSLEQTRCFLVRLLCYYMSKGHPWSPSCLLSVHAPRRPWASYKGTNSWGRYWCLWPDPIQPVEPADDHTVVQRNIGRCLHLLEPFKVYQYLALWL